MQSQLKSHSTSLNIIYKMAPGRDISFIANISRTIVNLGMFMWVTVNLHVTLLLQTKTIFPSRRRLANWSPKVYVKSLAEEHNTFVHFVYVGHQTPATEDWMLLISTTRCCSGRSVLTYRVIFFTGPAPTIYKC